jgi:hypothetical protein
MIAAAIIKITMITGPVAVRVFVGGGAAIE